MKKIASRYLHEPKDLVQNGRHIFQERKILAQLQPDIVISRLALYGFSSYFLCKGLNYPLVIEADCPPIYENDTFYGKNNFHLKRTVEYIEQRVLRGSDAVSYTHLTLPTN